ncbi:hypothetical protein COOONC_01604 [Cooperia oncophora]
MRMFRLEISLHHGTCITSIDVFGIVTFLKKNWVTQESSKNCQSFSEIYDESSQSPKDQENNLDQDEETTLRKEASGT